MKEGFKILITLDLIAFFIGTFIGGQFWLGTLITGLIFYFLVYCFKTPAAIVPLCAGFLISPKLFTASLIIIFINICAYAYLHEEER